MKEKRPRGLSALWEAVFPRRCLLCGKPVGPEACFCRECEARVPAEPLLRVLKTWGEKEYFLFCAAPLRYEGQVKGAIYRFKFRGKRAMAATLAQAMERAARSLEEEPEVLSYVPMEPRRQRERGYNQSELLAEELGARLGLPVTGLLKKTGQGRVQHWLSAKGRQENAQNHYQASPEAARKKILLVDDIVTTGATLGACAGALYREGALQVWAVCAADAELAPRGG